MKNTILALALLIGAGLTAAHADTFGTGDNQFTIDFTTIGNPGNAADTTGYGSVGYTFRIGTYAISQNQIDKATASGLANVTAGAWSGDKPAAYISWYEAAAFVNWLNTRTGHQAAYNLSFNTNIYQGAYPLDYIGGTWSMSLWNSLDPGYNSFNQYRNANAYYFLPSEDEWYKAAYGKSDASGYFLYPTASDTAPTAVASGTSAGTAIYNQPLRQGPASVYAAGGLSSYGTMGQGGNVWQWMESAHDGVNDSTSELRELRGGDWSDFKNSPIDGLPASYRSVYAEPDFKYDGIGFVGFRVASVPEPSTYALFGLGASALIIAYRRRTA
jgi:hypothetical protein